CSKKCELCNGISWTDSNAACDPITGACKCERGYKGPDCKQRVCEEDMYGLDCSKQCTCVMENTESYQYNARSFHTFTSRCAPDTGYCRCKPGYVGDSCEQICSKLNWGRDCANTCECNYNYTSECDLTTGRCICLPGRTGEKCVPNSFSLLFYVLCADECPDGYFGLDCAFKCQCGENGVCDKRNGSCKCRNGFHGATCSISCPAGHFGESCAACQCRNGAGCDPVTGDCHCAAGWTGAKCDTPCAAGTYGPHCAIACRCKNGGECDRFTGECKCTQGFKGMVIVDFSDGTFWCRANFSAAFAIAKRRPRSAAHDATESLRKIDHPHPFVRFSLHLSMIYFLLRWGLHNNLRVQAPIVRRSAKMAVMVILVKWTATAMAAAVSKRLGNVYAVPENREIVAIKVSTISALRNLQHLFLLECNAGQFGFGCREFCGNCTLDSNTGQCDSKTGACLKCPPGRSGANCQHSCEDGKWGQDCAQKCSCADGHNILSTHFPDVILSLVLASAILDTLARLASSVSCIYSEFIPDVLLFGFFV
ncbi:unnamed protein product, partial [Cylicostephanus goldi]